MTWFFYDNKTGNYYNSVTGKQKTDAQLRKNGFSAVNARRLAINRETVTNNKNGTVVKSYNGLVPSYFQRPVNAILSLATRTTNAVAARITFMLDIDGRSVFVSTGYLGLNQPTLQEAFTMAIGRYGVAAIKNIDIGILGDSL